jgi:magnesium transporter
LNLRLINNLGKKSGQMPGELLHVGRVYGQEATVKVYQYNAENLRVTEVKKIEDITTDPSMVTWVNIIGIHDTDLIEEIGRRFSVHHLLLEDVVNTNHRPKQEEYENYLYIVLKSFDQDPTTLDTEQISIIVGDNLVISFQEKASDLFALIISRIVEGKGRLRRAGADYLAYGLIDLIVDNYFVVLEAIGEKIEDLEERLIYQPGPDALTEIHKLKRQMLYLRKALWPLREIIGTLSRGESPRIKDTTYIYLRDVYDHTIQIIDTLETYRDIVSGMLDIYLSSISNRMNQIMKVLTIISTVFIPLTFIVGLYGMNFKYMPELEWEWGYPAVLVVMILISIAMTVYFRTRKWL